MLQVREIAVTLRNLELEKMSELKRWMNSANWQKKIVLRCEDGLKFEVEEPVAWEIPAIRDMMVFGLTDIVIPDLPTSVILKKAIQYCRVVAKTRNRIDSLSGEVDPAHESTMSELTGFTKHIFAVDMSSLLALKATACYLGLTKLEALTNHALESCKNFCPVQGLLSLRSKDGFDVIVEAKVAMMSQTIYGLFLEKDDDENIIQLPNISFKILNMVMEFCKVHKYANNMTESFDAAFLMVDPGTLFDLIMAANYLQVEELMDLTKKAYMVLAAPPVRARPFVTDNMSCKDNEFGDKFITLRSMDGTVFEIELIAAMECETIRRRMEDGFASQVILLPNISSEILRTVLVCCRSLVGFHSVENITTEQMMDASRKTLIELKKAAEGLGVKMLVDIAKKALNYQEKQQGPELELSKAYEAYKAAGLKEHQQPVNFPKGKGAYGPDIDRNNELLAKCYHACNVIRYQIQRLEGGIDQNLGASAVLATLLCGFFEDVKKLRAEILDWGGEPFPVPPELEEALNAT